MCLGWIGGRLGQPRLESRCASASLRFQPCLLAMVCRCTCSTVASPLSVVPSSNSSPASPCTPQRDSEPGCRHRAPRRSAHAAERVVDVRRIAGQPGPANAGSLGHTLVPGTGCDGGGCRSRPGTMRAKSGAGVRCGSASPHPAPRCGTGNMARQRPECAAEEPFLRVGEVADRARRG